MNIIHDPCSTFQAAGLLTKPVKMMSSPNPQCRGPFKTALSSHHVRRVPLHVRVHFLCCPRSEPHTLRSELMGPAADWTGNTQIRRSGFMS